MGDGVGMDAFRSWQSAILPTMLLSRPMVELLRQACVFMSEHLAAEEVELSNLRWQMWVEEGPAKGLRRQHRMSRVAQGWIPSGERTLEVNSEELLQVADDDCLRRADMQPSIVVASTTCVPRSLQEEVDHEAAGWQREWGCFEEFPDCEWPQDLGTVPPQLQVSIFRDAIRTFPTQLGLGWDRIHPRALLRLEDELIAALLRVLFLCECAGRWPHLSALVVISLLAKPGGGHRPIGLFPWLPKVWAKARREVAKAWEAANSRPYLFAGAGRGADHAAWKQAARAELAGALQNVSFGMTFLDLVKAFDRIPHYLVVREALRLGFNLWVLRLSIAAYKASRVLKIDGTCSALIKPRRSITAGSAFATTEMRIIFINIIDKALRLAPLVQPSLYVDDLSAEAAGGDNVVAQQVVAFTMSVCNDVTTHKMEVSCTKSLCMASNTKLGQRIRDGLRRYGIQLRHRVTSLGAGLGAGRRRNAIVLKKRLTAFVKRLPRFRKLARARVRTARLLRTGGLASLSYGQSISGVAPSTLLRQRRAAAAAAAPATGPSGQDIDLALMVADEGPNGRADPAFDAHVQPIHMWALAVWQRWLPIRAMDLLITNAAERFSNARSVWQHVRGPGAAVLATARRLNWSFDDAATMVSDTGRTFNLLLDPPVVIKAECIAAVKRWRDAAVFQKYSHLGDFGDSHGLMTLPLWKLLKAKDEVMWSGKHKGALRSAVTDRQWPQDRCWTADMTQHDRCRLCVESAKQSRQQAGTRDGGTTAATSSSAHARVAPEQCDDAERAGSTGSDCEQADDLQDVNTAPVGTLMHRVCECPQLQILRQEHGPKVLLDNQRCGVATPGQLCAAYSSGLYPNPKLTFAPQDLPPPGGSIEWICGQQLGQCITGIFYTDGSRRDILHPDTVRMGWSFVVIDSTGQLIAAARGCPPLYITDNTGAEAWALLQAIAYSGGGSQFRTDSKPCVDSIVEGRVGACSAFRPLARVFNLVFDIMEHKGVEDSMVVWMPAHTSQANVGRLTLSNGDRLSPIDRHANDLADSHAKIAARAYAADPAVLEQVKQYQEDVAQALRWLGIATWAATHGREAGLVTARDSSASRLRAGMVKRARHATTAASRQQDQTRGNCRNNARASFHPSHSMMATGRLQWCGICGAYAASRGRALIAPCTGRTDPTASGGRAQQLRMLKSGRHPKTGQRLIHETRRGGNVVESEGRETTGHDSNGAEQDDTHLLAQTTEGRRRLRVRARLAGVPPPDCAVEKRSRGGNRDGATQDTGHITGDANAKRRLASEASPEVATEKRRQVQNSSQHDVAPGDANRLAGISQPSTATEKRPHGSAGWKDDRCPTGNNDVDSKFRDSPNAKRMRSNVQDADTTRKRRVALRSLLEAARAPVDPVRHEEAPHDACPAPKTTPELGGQVLGTSRHMTDDDADGFDLESELARIIVDTAHAGNNAMAVAADGRSGQSVTSHCDATVANEGEGRARPATLDIDSSVRSNASPGAVSVTEKRRLLGSTGVDAMRNKRTRTSHPALARSRVAPLPSTRNLDIATNSRGMRELTTEVKKIRKRGIALSSSDDEDHSAKRRKAMPPGPVEWKPIHLPRRRHKPVGVKVKQKQSASQATYLSTGGGQGA